MLRCLIDGGTLRMGQVIVHNSGNCYGVEWRASLVSRFTIGILAVNDAPVIY